MESFFFVFFVETQTWPAIGRQWSRTLHRRCFFAHYSVCCSSLTNIKRTSPSSALDRAVSNMHQQDGGRGGSRARGSMLVFTSQRIGCAAGEFRVLFLRGFPQRRPRSCSLGQDPCDRSRAFATSATSAATHLAQKSRYFCNCLTQPVN